MPTDTRPVSMRQMCDLLLPIMRASRCCESPCSSRRRRMAIPSAALLSLAFMPSKARCYTIINGFIIEALVASGDRPLDETLLELASQRIGEAQAARQTALEMPESAAEINEAAKLMDSWGDYGTARDSLASAEAELSSSIAQLKQITNPSEQFVIERLTGLPNVVAIEAVTEGNDPNGKLGKAGGYTATVYFSSDLVDQSSVYRTEGHTYVVGGGCDGGGAVEVFATEEDAQRRNEYLAILDGGLLASGSHAVYGTCVVRTSDLLAASQQKALEESIVASLTELR